MARYPQAILVSCEIPWDEDSNLMEDVFRKEVRVTLQEGFNNLYIFGTAGEGYAIDTARFRQIVQIFYEETRGQDVHPMVGIIGLSTPNIVERAGIAHGIGFRTFQLPWSFSLERFKMDRDPGTTNPASYESFVNVRDPQFQKTENAHIFMNNPLKKGKYTFYQASYFPVDENVFGSVLQVNYDPGRFLKYAGSLILILGTILHFYIRRPKRASH